MVEEPLTQAKGKKIGILGGTFNPPHLAHLMIAEQVASQLGLDKILFIPDYLPPHVDKKKRLLRSIGLKWFAWQFRGTLTLI